MEQAVYKLGQRSVDPPVHHSITAGVNRGSCDLGFYSNKSFNERLFALPSEEPIWAECETLPCSTYWGDKRKFHHFP